MLSCYAGTRRKTLQKQYTNVRKDVEILLLQSKDLEKSNFRLIQSNETLKAQMELQVHIPLYCDCCEYGSILCVCAVEERSRDRTHSTTW